MTTAAEFGATLEKVKALLPHRRWAPDVRPSEADVLDYLESHADLASARLGPLPGDAALMLRLLGLGRRYVVFAAAADAEAAGASERARPNDVTAYATWLLERATAALEQAGTLADAAAPGDEPAGVEPVAAEPAWSFPEPERWAERGI